MSIDSIFGFCRAALEAHGTNTLAFDERERRHFGDEKALCELRMFVDVDFLDAERAALLAARCAQAGSPCAAPDPTGGDVKDKQRKTVLGHTEGRRYGKEKKPGTLAAMGGWYWIGVSVWLRRRGRRSRRRLRSPRVILVAVVIAAADWLGLGYGRRHLAAGRLGAIS